MMDVWFIRHGECTANIGDATSSAHEAHLTARGWQEAYAIADYLSHLPEHKLTRIISSPYIRARQTALATQDMLGVKNVETLPVQEFNYLALPTVTAIKRSHLQTLLIGYKMCSISCKDRSIKKICLLLFSVIINLCWQ